MSDRTITKRSAPIRRTAAYQRLSPTLSEDSSPMATLSTGDANLDDIIHRELLSCPICLEMYDERNHQPKMLACHHTFCRECLEKTLRNRSTLICSTCRQDTFLSRDGGISALQTNFYLTYMKIKFNEQAKCTTICFKHAQQPLSFFCKTCTQLVCRDCIVLAHSKYDGHDLHELSDVKVEYVSTLQQLTTKVDKTIDLREEQSSCLRAEMDTLDIVADVACQQVDQVFDSLVEIVNSRRAQMKDLLRETHDSKHRAINEMWADIDTQTKQLKIIKDDLNQAMQQGQLKAIIDQATDAKLMMNIRGLTEDVNLNTGRNYFQFKAENAERDLTNLIQDVGQVDLNEMLPSRIEITDSTETIACLPVHIGIKVSTCESDSTPLPSYEIGMQIIDPEGTDVECEMIDNQDGSYICQFRPQISGNHMCTVTFLGSQIASTVMSKSVRSNNPVGVIGSMGKEEGLLMYPCSLKIDSHNDIYVVDEGNQRIQKFSDEGSVEVIPIPGGRTFDCALNLHNDEIICTKVNVESKKAWADTIQILESSGNLKSSFTNQDMKKALYVAINSSNEIVVSDYHLNKIFKYSHDGELLQSIGEMGTDEGQFREPAFICIGRNDDIIISDCRNCRIQVLDKDGQFKHQIGRRGGGKGQLQGPSGVACDKNGNILVTDRVNHRIQVFTYEGEFVCCIESKGDTLNDPRGLAITNDGHVLVADQKNHCIKKYRYM